MKHSQAGCRAPGRRRNIRLTAETILKTASQTMEGNFRDSGKAGVEVSG